MSWGTEKTPGVQKMTENGGDHVLCTTVYVERGNRKLRVTTAIPEVFQTPAEENVNVPSSEELREVVSHPRKW